MIIPKLFREPLECPPIIRLKKKYLPNTGTYKRVYNFLGSIPVPLIVHFGYVSDVVGSHELKVIHTRESVTGNEPVHIRSKATDA